MTSECTEKMRVSKIVVGENRAKASFRNDERRWFWVTKVDGCLCHNETAADFVIEKQDQGVVVVELKGKDVPHGVEQVRATAKFWKDKNPETKRIAGLVVARQHPRHSTSIQRHVREFARTFRGPLHVVSSKREFVFENVQSFDGP
ncbi:hypothetical protein [Bradyrhizobium sp. MOS003]|uniref:hypothetical protein n=1 Tax=Bradyrhizobium sp. MOS003 TaxID=2133946 RepID=UPI0011BDFDB0|nr:hypothetical protein [Bradyrhizobium sp. MOS003]